MTGTRSVAHTIEKREVHRFLFDGHYTWTVGQGVRLTIKRQLFS
jgi:hypothetical protein